MWFCWYRNRSWLLLLAVFMTVSLFAVACGEPDPAEAPPEETEEATEPEAAETDEAEPAEEMDEEALASLFMSGMDLEELSYEMHLSGPAMEEVQVRVWMQGDRMRSESEYEGERFIVIIDEEASYILEPAEKMAFRSPKGAGEDPELDETSEPMTVGEVTTDTDPADFEYLGTEEVEGILCHVVQTEGDEPGDTLTLWLHSDYGFPMKIEQESDTPDRQYLVEIKNLEVGNVSDQHFEVPSDYEIVDFGEMMMP